MKEEGRLTTAPKSLSKLTRPRGIVHMCFIALVIADGLLVEICETRLVPFFGGWTEGNWEQTTGISPYTLLVVLILLGVWMLGSAIAYRKRKSLAISLTILSAVIGCSVGFFIAGDYDPPWTRLSIHPLPATPVSIVHVDINSTQDDPTGDILFIEAVDGKVYSLRLFEDQWELVDQVPDLGNVVYTENCATDWPNHSLVVEGIIDSVGVRIEHALATVLRCYVLTDDYSLQVWVHSSDAWDLLDVVYQKMIFAAMGGDLAIIIAFLILLRKHGTTR